MSAIESVISSNFITQRSRNNIKKSYIEEERDKEIRKNKKKIHRRR